MEPVTTDYLLNELINDFLEGQENYLELSVKEKEKTFDLYKTILTTVQDTIQNPETEGIICPLLLNNNSSTLLNSINVSGSL